MKRSEVCAPDRPQGELFDGLDLIASFVAFLKRNWLVPRRSRNAIMRKVQTCNCYAAFLGSE
jgi:hypothetical protein